MRALALFFLCFAAQAAQVTCTGTVSEGAVNLSCAGAGGPPPPPPPPDVPAPPAPPSGCAPATVNGVFEYSGKPYNFSISSGQTASYRLPPLTTSPRWAEIIAFQSTATPSDLNTEVALADCPGKFDVAPECKQAGNAWSSVDLHGNTPPGIGYCVLTIGKTYYANVRNDCRQNTCEQRIQYFGDLR